ncbi:putative Chaperone J-domain superfamily [Helianthus annuus]|uniref:Chaperone J-domain superfamily n=1 Tax=Helianthus annuus TaxID=4232 RepID=A0A9K3P000_HELAN|nr:putative Chaperone J-domain superfamily [Helianthus annuus]KAJ0619766.1 putative Chaperone J-domain superfamily [Helianthus annuus]KAJ0787209.1 putative Chaperone J-domain superfamily [Helianthus annuus]KAJ0952866.1 putative Chaperone J-domain superfamily [Helianthus annuus]
MIIYSCQYHPDVNKDSQASEVFKSVHLAYETDGPCGLRKIWIWSLVFLKYTDGPSGLHFVTHLVPNFAKTARDSDGPVSVLSGQIPKSVGLFGPGRYNQFFRPSVILVLVLIK